MDLDCLLSSGLITQADYDRLKPFINLGLSANGIQSLLLASSLATPRVGFTGGPAIGFEELTVTDAVVSKLLNIPTGTTSYVITAYTNPCYFRVDGADPAANQAHLIPVGQNLSFTNPAASIRFIGDGGDSILFVTYF